MPVCESTVNTPTITIACQTPLRLVGKPSRFLELSQFCVQVSGSGCSFPIIHEAIGSLTCCLVKTDSTQTTILVLTPTQTYLTHILSSLRATLLLPIIYTAKLQDIQSQQARIQTNILLSAIPPTFQSAYPLQQASKSSNHQAGREQAQKSLQPGRAVEQDVRHVDEPAERQSNRRGGAITSEFFRWTWQHTRWSYSANTRRSEQQRGEEEYGWRGFVRKEIRG